MVGFLFNNCIFTIKLDLRVCPNKHTFCHFELVEKSPNSPIAKPDETFRQAQGDECVSSIFT